MGPADLQIEVVEGEGSDVGARFRFIDPDLRQGLWFRV